MRDYIKKIRTKNIYSYIELVINPFIEELKMKNEVVGIVLLSGLGKRQFIDKYSDLDISIFVNNGGNFSWLPQFEFYIPNNFGGFFEINVHQNTIEREQTAIWEEGKKEAYKDGIVVYDPYNEIGRLINNKIAYNEKESEERINKLVTSIRSFGISESSINDHLALNKMLNQIVELFYIANREYRPHKKWRLEKTMYFKLIPKNFQKLLHNSIQITDLTKKGVMKRKKSLDDLFKFFIKHHGIIEKNNGFSHRYQNDIGYYNFDKKKALTLICGQLKWYIDINPIRQMKRDFLLNSNDLINEGLVMILEASNIMWRKQLCQQVEALNVLHNMEYIEDCYSMNFDNLPDMIKKPFITAMKVPDISKETIKERVHYLQMAKDSFLKILKKQDLIPTDPYHFALKYCYFDRQLNSKTFSDYIIPNNLNEPDKKLCIGFINYNLVGSIEELMDALCKTSSDIYSETQLKAIKRIIKTSVFKYTR